MPANTIEIRETQNGNTAIAATNSLRQDENERGLSTANSLVVVNAKRPISAANSTISISRQFDRKPNPATNSLSEITDQVQAYEDGLEEFPFALSRAEVHGERLILNGTSLELGDDGVGTICKLIGAPFNYVNDLPGELKEKNLTFGLRKTGEQGKRISDKTSVVLGRGGRLAGFRRADLCHPPAIDLIRAIEEGLGEAANGSTAEVTCGAESFTVDIVSDHLPQVKGDVCKSGIRLEHSLTGDEATRIFGHVVRLQCLNGLTVRECVGARQGARARRFDSKQPRARELQFDQIKNLVVDMKQTLKNRIDAITKLQNESVEEREMGSTFERFLRSARLHSDNMMRLLHWAWQQADGGNGQTTYFGMLNAFTFLGTYGAIIRDTNNKVIYEVSDRQRNALAVLAGVFANQHVHMCPACFRRIGDTHEHEPATEETRA